jgi:hypothetical protein
MALKVFLLFPGLGLVSNVLKVDLNQLKSSIKHSAPNSTKLILT